MITNEILKNIKHVHFIGIGGSGMYPLVQIFHSKGYFITGSDNNETETLEAVRKLGIEVFLGQRAENIKGADLIIYTAAIMADNPELIAAKASGAICEAFRKIKDGYLDVCLCGGSEACISHFALSGFNNMKALSKATELDKASTPFDLNRQGFVLGEGAGILCLEEYEHAKARGANIIAEIAGYGATGDAYHMTSPSPTGEAAAHAMKYAYEEAGLKPEQVNYINAHGTSTGLNDKYETTAIKLALGEEAARKTVINSTKSMTGHLLGAAGGMEAIVTALSVQNDFVHKTINYTTPDPECDLDYCVEGNREMPVYAALSNSLGFGGHNATICIKKCD